MYNVFSNNVTISRRWVQRYGYFDYFLCYKLRLGSDSMCTYLCFKELHEFL